MIIILPFSSNVTTYLDKIVNWYSTSYFLCPNCKSTTQRHGRYLRSCYDFNESTVIPIYRRYCPNCKISFSFIPSFIKPYARFLNSYRLKLFKRHELESTSIKKTPFFSSPKGNFISPDTFRRWLKKLKSIVSTVNTFITSKLFELAPALSLPKDLSDLAFLFHCANVFQKLAYRLLPNYSIDAFGIFDLLNLQLTKDLWL